MANEAIVGVSRVVQLLHRDRGTAVVAAASVITKIRAVGHQRVLGNFHSDQLPASGYPRIRQSEDGSTWSYVKQIPRDFSQANFQYPFDLVVRYPYVEVEWIQGGVDAADFGCNVWLTPVVGSGIDVLPGNTDSGLIGETTAQTADVALLAASDGRTLIGFSIREIGGAGGPARGTLRHGTGAGDPAIAFFSLGGDEVADVNFTEGMVVAAGVFLDMDTGTVDVTLRYKD